MLFFAQAVVDYRVDISGGENPINPYFVMDYPHATPPDAESIAMSVALLFLAVYVVIFLLLGRYRQKLIDVMGRGKYAAATVLLNILMIVGFFAGVEYALEVYRDAWYAQHAQDTTAYRPDPVKIWDIVPGFDFMKQERDKKNRTGIITDNRLNVPKSAGEIRVLCLGDSSTMGWTDPQHTVPEAPYPQNLENALRERFPAKNISVINAGLSGYTSFQGLMLLKQVIDSKPDLITLAFAFHDANLDYDEDKSHMTDNERVQAARIILYRSQLYLLLRKYIVGYKNAQTLRDPSHRVKAVPRVAKEDYLQNIEAMRALAQANGAKLMLINMPLNWDVRLPATSDYVGYQKLNLEYGQKSGVPVLDANQTWNAHREPDLFQPTNPNHLVLKGSQRLARELADFIARHNLLP